jgi:uncharacterized membrane protein YgcG
VKILSLSLVGILLVADTTTSAAGSAANNNNIINRLFQIAEAQLNDNNNNNNAADVSIVSQRAYSDANLFHIVGEVQNTGKEASEYVQIVASFYDGNGQFVGTSYTFTTPTTVSPAMKAPFDIQLLTDDRIVKESKNYQLTLSWIDQNGKEIVKQYESAQLGQGQQQLSSPIGSGDKTLSQTTEAIFTAATDISFGAKALQFLTYCNSQFSQTPVSNMTIDTLVFCTMVYDWYYIGCNNAIIAPIIAAQCKDPIIIQQVNNYKTQIDIRIRQIIVPPPPEPCDPAKNQTCASPPPTCSPTQYYDSSEKKCVTPPPPDFACIATTYMRYDPIKKQWECIPLFPTPGMNTTIPDPGNNETSLTGQEQQKQTISPEERVYCPASLDYRYNPITNSCEYLGPPEGSCKKDPTAKGCELAPDPCSENPTAVGCEPLPDDGIPPPIDADTGDISDSSDSDSGDSSDSLGDGGGGEGDTTDSGDTDYGGGGDSGGSDTSGDSSSAGDAAK